MIDEKIRVRIDDFTEKILWNDSTRFGFIKNNDEPNMNAFLNKLIPNLIDLRKKRREIIHETLKEELNYMAEKIPADKLQLYLDRVVDKVYFPGENETLISNIWIRPSKENFVVFDEILEFELSLTRQTVSEYIRCLLNEYIHLPQYKREQILYSKELHLFSESIYNHNIVHLTHKDKKHKVIVLNYFYGYAYAQDNYVICYDTNKNVIKAFLLHDLEHVYSIKQKYAISDDIDMTFKEIVENGDFIENDTFEIKEHRNEENK